MKVGLIDVDGHRWPNLCLMKLSAYHRARGDNVVNLSRKSANYKFTRMKKPFVIP